MGDNWNILEGVWNPTTLAYEAEEYVPPAPIQQFGYSYAGRDASSQINDCTEFDHILDTWTVKTPLGTNRQSPAACSVVDSPGGADKGLVTGGYFSNYLGTTEWYDFDTDSWAARALFSPVRSGHGQVNLDEGAGQRAYAFAGGSTFNNLLDNDQYYPLGNSWATRQNVPGTARANVAATPINNYGHIFGGWEGGLTRTSDHDYYNPGGDSWVNRTPLITSRSDCEACTVLQKAYLFGGLRYSGGMQYLNNNDEYDQLTNSWTAKAVLVPGRFGVGTVGLNDKAYVYSGHDGGTYLADCDEYDPVSNTYVAKADLPTIRRDIGASENPTPY